MLPKTHSIPSLTIQKAQLGYTEVGLDSLKGSDAQIESESRTIRVGCPSRLGMPYFGDYKLF